MSRYIDADFLLTKVVKKYKSAKGKTKAAYKDVCDMICAMGDTSDMVYAVMFNAKNKEIKEYVVSDTEKLNFDFKSKEGFAFQNYMDMLMGKENGKRRKNEQIY